MGDLSQLAESAERVRSRVTAVAPYSMLRKVELHGTISLSVEGKGGEFMVGCGVCSEWSEVHSLDYEAAISALEDHLLAAHGDYGTELVVMFR